jgi:hypothetical protein
MKITYDDLPESEQERLILTLIFGKIKNDLEQVGDIDKICYKGREDCCFDETDMCEKDGEEE